MFYAILLGAMGGWMLASGIDDLSHKRRSDGAVSLVAAALMILMALLISVIEVLPLFMDAYAT